MRWSLGCLPAVGLLAGGLLYGWSVLGAVTGMQPVLFGAVAVLLPIVLSGGFHMDGFLDAADGIFSRRDRQKRLEIMKDPHCGPFAVLCCGGLLLLELGAWCQLASVPKLLPLACCLFTVSRSLTVMAGQPPPLYVHQHARRALCQPGGPRRGRSRHRGDGGFRCRVVHCRLAVRRCRRLYRGGRAGRRGGASLLVVRFHGPPGVRRDYRGFAGLLCGAVPRRPAACPGTLFFVSPRIVIERS